MSFENVLGFQITKTDTSEYTDCLAADFFNRIKRNDLILEPGPDISFSFARKAIEHGARVAVIDASLGLSLNADGKYEGYGKTFEPSYVASAGGILRFFDASVRFGRENQKEAIELQEWRKDYARRIGVEVFPELVHDSIPIRDYGFFGNEYYQNIVDRYALGHFLPPSSSKYLVKLFKTMLAPGGTVTSYPFDSAPSENSFKSNLRKGFRFTAPEVKNINILD